MGGKGKCTDQNIVYGITCDFPNCVQSEIGRYVGETYRPIHERFTEHSRSAKNPTAKSYQDKPLSKHYATEHPNCQDPKISLTIHERATSINNRKIKEARTILTNKPDLNSRDEKTEIQRFVI